MLQNRDEIRRTFCAVWDKHRDGSPLDSLETLIRDVIVEHPEYHGVLNDSDSALGREYQPEMGQTNPFLHMGMHISLREQLATDRPAGIRNIYQARLARRRDRHAVEHQMMECLGRVLWEAQRAGALPDEQAYLNCLRHLRS
jgi:predicted Rdx family selenoprotein